jgi:bifunctional non-homologous end joining protein LigD
VRKTKLATYQAKRDFTQTAEPSGENRVAPSQRLRFVIQKHAARRLHYDLRLELDGVFKSWAVTRGPSLDPHERRLAVEVEDHPLDYGDFEGTIPRGQYGGGAVLLCDRGYWMPEGIGADAGLAKGDLKFTLEGERLHGSWVLVRMKHDRMGGKRTNWLLIKHRDEYALDGDGDAILAEDRSVASGRTMAEIAAGKGRGPKPFMLATKADAEPDAVWHSNRDANDPPVALTPMPAPREVAKSATNAKTNGKPKKRIAMPRFVEPQLCKDVDSPPKGPAWVHEIKFDGYRMQLRVEDGAATILTRKGLDWTAKFRAVAESSRKLPEVIIDGEIVALDHKGIPEFTALQAALSDGNTDELIYFAFDLLFADGEDLREFPLAERKQRLHRMIEALGDERIRFVEHFQADGGEVLESARQMGLEGIVSKRLDAPYRAGRGTGWTKAKCRPGHDVVIGAWTDTEGRFRSLLGGVYSGGHLAYVGRIGTGFSEVVVRGLMPLLKGVAADESPFSGKNAPRYQRNFHWLKPELVAEIEFGGWTTDGLVRQAAFKRLRDDKPAREVVAEEPAPAAQVEIKEPVPMKEKEQTAKPKTIAVPKAAHVPIVMGVAISNADKPLWPDDGNGRAITKLDLARYYEAVGPWIIRHLEGRPCSIIRAPDGIKDEHFFQRHAMAGMSKLLNLVKVSGDHEAYVQIDRLDALAAVAQIAGVELHPWNCYPGNPELPGRLVFDLDPAPDVEFAMVVEAALELRERLSAIGLESFCKTTGGKGMHVVTPLTLPKDKTIDWAVTKNFAREVCARMAADRPDRYLVKMTKKDREGRIYLDYLRNDRMATAVAVLSPRARDGAPVSMPLTWTQVRKGPEPMRYTLRTVPALLSRSDAWSEYFDAARPFGEAIRRLDESGVKSKEKSRKKGTAASDRAA